MNPKQPDFILNLYIGVLQTTRKHMLLGISILYSRNPAESQNKTFEYTIETESEHVEWCGVKL